MHSIRPAGKLAGFALSLTLSFGATVYGSAPAAPAASSATAQVAQAGLTFDVATIRPSAPLDMQKLAADVQAGRMPKIGPQITGSQAEYTYMSLKDLIALAYGVKGYQVTGPDWLASQRFDIVAKMPAGATKDQAPAMLKALLIERFKLAAEKSTQEHPALALIVGKGGPKVTEVAKPELTDESAPLKPGEMKMDTADGQARVMRNPDGSTTINLGAKGSYVQRMDAATQVLRLEGKGLTMAGFADMLTSVMAFGGGGNPRQVVDMTGLKGYYEVAVEFSLADLMAVAKASGMDIPSPAGVAAAAAPTGTEASDPTGNSSVYDSVQKLGLKLEPRKAMVEQVVVAHAEKLPTDN